MGILRIFIVNAAFLAAEESGVITMEHVIKATSSFDTVKMFEMEKGKSYKKKEKKE